MDTARRSMQSHRPSPSVIFLDFSCMTRLMFPSLETCSITLFSYIIMFVFAKFQKQQLWFFAKMSGKNFSKYFATKGSTVDALGSTVSGWAQVYIFAYASFGRFKFRNLVITLILTFWKDCICRNLKTMTLNFHQVLSLKFSKCWNTCVGQQKSMAGLI